MEIFRRRCIWSNLQVILLKRRIKSVVSKSLYDLMQSSRAWFKKYNITISGIDFHRCYSNHSVFVRHTKSGIIALVVYVDILLTDSDLARLLESKEYLKRYFVIKNMRKPKYFLGIEVAYQNHYVLLSQ